MGFVEMEETLNLPTYSLCSALCAPSVIWEAPPVSITSFIPKPWKAPHLCTEQTDQEKQTRGLPIKQYLWRALPWIPQRSCGNRFCKTVLRKVKDLCLATEYVKLCLLINAVIITLQQHCKHYGLAHTRRNFSVSCHGPAPPLVAFLWTIGSAAGTLVFAWSACGYMEANPKEVQGKNQSCCFSASHWG